MRVSHPELRAFWRKLLADAECRRAWFAVERLARMDSSMARFRKHVERMS